MRDALPVIAWTGFAALLLLPSALAVLACIGRTRTDRAAGRDHEADAMAKENAR